MFIKFKPNKHSFCLQRDGLWVGIWMVSRTLRRKSEWDSKQVRTVRWGTIVVIYKMFCNGRPVCIVYLVSKVVSLPYFHRYILFYSRIQTLIGSPDVLQTANTSKGINQRAVMLGGRRTSFRPDVKIARARKTPYRLVEK